MYSVPADSSENDLLFDGPDICTNLVQLSAIRNRITDFCGAVVFLTLINSIPWHVGACMRSSRR